MRRSLREACRSQTTVADMDQKTHVSLQSAGAVWKHYGNSKSAANAITSQSRSDHSAGHKLTLPGSREIMQRHPKLFRFIHRLSVSSNAPWGSNRQCLPRVRGLRALGSAGNIVLSHHAMQPICWTAWG